MYSASEGHHVNSPIVQHLSDSLNQHQCTVSNVSSRFFSFLDIWSYTSLEKKYLFALPGKSLVKHSLVHDASNI